MFRTILSYDHTNTLDSISIRLSNELEFGVEWRIGSQASFWYRNGSCHGIRSLASVAETMEQDSRRTIVRNVAWEVPLKFSTTYKNIDAYDREHLEKVLEGMARAAIDGDRRKRNPYENCLQNIKDFLRI